MPFAVGETIGPYRIMERLGQGGMATVYRAFHAKLDRYVAIKVLHAALKTDPSFSARFEREAKLVAALEHPNIVPIFDYNEHNNEPYLVMKFVEGQTLKGRLESGPLTLAEALRILTAVGSALNYAHERGILHRDIKPSNVLLDKSGETYLADFGLARMAIAGESTLSQDMLLGTPHYISPEQARGVKDLDAATDVYSLGVMLYELVVGRVPYNADTPYAIIHSQIYAPLPLPSAVNPTVPTSVERVLLKALAKDRADRHPSAGKLVEAFRAALRECGITDPNTVTLPFRGAPAARRPPTTIPVPTPVAQRAGSTAAPAATGAVRRTPPKSEGRNALLLTGLGAAAVLVVLAALALAANMARPAASVGLAASATRVIVTLPPQPPTPTRTATPTLPLTPTPTSSQAAAPAATDTADLGDLTDMLLDLRRLRTITENQARQYIAQNPDDPRGYFVLGVTLARAGGRSQEASSVFGEMIKRVKDNPTLMMTMARRLKALNARGDNPVLRASEVILYAYVYAAAGAANPDWRAQTGEEIYKFASEAPLSISAMNAAGSPRVDLLKAVAQDNESGYLYAAWALAASLVGDKESGKQAMMRALKLAGDLPEVRLIEGILFKMQGRSDEARRALIRASRLLIAPRWVRQEAQGILQKL